MSQKYNIEVASKESTSAQKALPATACRAASAFSIPLSLPRHPVHLRFEDFFLSFSIFFFIIIIIFHFLFLISLDLNCFVIPIAVLIPVLSLSHQFAMLYSYHCNCQLYSSPSSCSSGRLLLPRPTYATTTSPHLSADLHHTYPLHFCNLSLRL